MARKRVKPASAPSVFGGILLFVFSILICQAAGALGALATMPNIPTWYAALVKPSFNPPNWVFGPVWTTLYFLMGVSLFLVARKGIRKNSVALTVFAVQLVVNSLWSVVFFGMRNPGGGFVVILFLLALIIWVMALFRRVRRSASWLLVPYAAWVSFAAFLNFSIWRLNP